MSARPLLLVLASAFVHAAWNAILKRCREPEHAVVGGSFVAAFFAVLVGAALGGFDLGRGRGVFWCLAAGVLEAAYFQTLARALGRGTLGTVYTVSRGGALLIVWPISVMLLGEQLTVLRLVGTLLVIVGLSASGRRPSGGATLPTGFALAALTGVFIGGYNLAYKMALADHVAAATANATSLGFAACINAVVLGRVRRAQAWAAVREAPLALGVAGFLAATGFLMFLAALATVGAGVIVTLRNTSILFAQAFGLALGERLNRIALAGTLAVTAGAIALAF